MQFRVGVVFMIAAFVVAVLPVFHRAEVRAAPVVAATVAQPAAAKSELLVAAVSPPAPVKTAPVKVKRRKGR